MNLSFSAEYFARCLFYTIVNVASAGEFKSEAWKSWKSTHMDNCIACVLAIPHRGKIWRNHLQPFWSCFSLIWEVLQLHSSAQAVVNMQRGRKGAWASRVSPRIMDCWAPAKLIRRLQVCVCVCSGDVLRMHLHACLSLRVLVQYKTHH